MLPLTFLRSCSRAAFTEISLTFMLYSTKILILILDNIRLFRTNLLLILDKLKECFDVLGNALFCFLAKSLLSCPSITYEATDR